MDNLLEVNLIKTQSYTFFFDNIKSITYSKILFFIIQTYNLSLCKIIII